MNDPFDSDYVDVLIVGAGLSGIGAGYRVQTELPGKTYAILEARDAIGGTWDLFRYPGVRSDSDMFTLGYPFRPWTDAKTIASGATILDYIRDTAAEFGIDDHIRFGQRVISASWSSAARRWSVTVSTRASGATESTERVVETSFLYLCSGYYDYEHPHKPPFPGVEAFEGRVVYPQEWPADLDVGGKQVVILGSGATAVTLVPALAPEAEHVTMLQRSPSYIMSLPDHSSRADRLRKRLPAQLAHSIIRWRSVLTTMAFYQFCRRLPDRAKAYLLKEAEANLPADFAMEGHFSPSYDPWDQRLCIVPNRDLFRTLGRGEATMVTDTIDRFTASGIRLSSGRELPADVVVSATGLTLLPAGGAALDVDGEPVDLGETYFYKGLMVSGVPNFAMCVGYTNASWTLRSDLSSIYVCRVLKHMDRHGYDSCVPLHTGDRGESLPLLDLTSNYVKRAQSAFPQRSTAAPWRLRQNYVLDLAAIRLSRVTDSMRFTRRGEAVGAQDPELVSSASAR